MKRWQQLSLGTYRPASADSYAEYAGVDGGNHVVQLAHVDKTERESRAVLLNVTTVPVFLGVCGCGCDLHGIGEDVSERLEVIPAQFRVIVTGRPKYACRPCTDGLVQDRRLLD